MFGALNYQTKSDTKIFAIEGIQYCYVVLDTYSFQAISLKKLLYVIN